LNYEEESDDDVREMAAILDAMGVPRRQPHRHSGLATLPSVGAVPFVTRGRHLGKISNGHKNYLRNRSSDPLHVWF